MSTHPIHLLNSQGRSFPTALVPFCSFAGNWKLLGQTLEGFSIPVCTAFYPTLFEGRKCYAIDVNEILSNMNLKVNYGEKNGLLLLVDTNGDRHFGTSEKTTKHTEAVIHIDTLEPLQVVGGGNIALTAIKRVDGDEDYYKYAAKKKICQNEEQPDICNTRMFLNTLHQKCNCVPLELLMLSKVTAKSIVTPAFS